MEAKLEILLVDIVALPELGCISPACIKIQCVHITVTKFFLMFSCLIVDSLKQYGREGCNVFFHLV